MIYANILGFLVSDHSLDELHCFAGKLGIERSWFREHPRHPHYPLLRYVVAKDGFVPDMVLIKDAFEKGAKVVSLRRLIQASRDWRVDHAPVGIQKSLSLYRQSGFLGV